MVERLIVGTPTLSATCSTRICLRLCLSLCSECTHWAQVLSSTMLCFTTHSTLSSPAFQSYGSLLSTLNTRGISSHRVQSFTGQVSRTFTSTSGCSGDGSFTDSGRAHWSCVSLYTHLTTNRLIKLDSMRASRSSVSSYSWFA